MKRAFEAFLLATALVGGGGWVRAAQAPDEVARQIQRLHDPDVQHRRDATRKLAKITPLPPTGIEAMAGLLERQDQDPLIERSAATALCDAGASAVPVAEHFAQSRDKSISHRGIGLLGCLANKNQDALNILIGIYKTNPDDYSIGEIARVGPPVLPMLFDALKGDVPATRAIAMTTINRMVSNARMFASADNAARNHFGIVAPKDLTPVEPQLAAALLDADPKIRNEAAIVLNYADPSDTRVLPILAALAAGGDRQFIGPAIGGLEAMGSAAKPAVPALEHALAKDPDVVLRMDAANALVRIDAAGACAPLEQAIVKDRDGRRALIQTTLGIHPTCSNIIPTLVATLRDERLYGSETITALSSMGSAAVPALATALKSSNLYVRQNSADALAGMKPLPLDAMRALQSALNDKNTEVRAIAIAALRTVGGEAQREAEAADKRDEQTAAAKPKPDTRLYSRKEIVAPIPADAEYMFPLTLAHLVPITKGGVAEAKLFVTIHAGKDRSDRLVFWKRIGADQYQQVKVMYSEEDYVGMGAHFEVPYTFHSSYERLGDRGTERRTGFFVDVPVTAWRSYQDNVLVVENDNLVPVQLVSPYGSPTGGSDFHDGKLEFSENIYNKDDATCCPTGGETTGTYKIIEDARQSPAVWKIVVATTKRIPPVSSLQPSH